MPLDPEQFDFFVSYARTDNATGWITGFVAELLGEHRRFSAGRELKPFFDQHAITTGADWQLYIRHGVAHSRLFLAFISPSYFASEWCRKEWRAWIDAEIAQHILTEGVRPIYIVEVPGLTGKSALSEQQVAQRIAELCRLPAPHDAFVAATLPVVTQMRRRDFSQTQVQSFFTEGITALRRADLHAVLEALAKDLDRNADLLRRADASVSTVPAYNAKFTGRLDELLHLRERLIQDDRTGIISGIHGLGGIGKTELAFTYAHAFASAYPGGRFIIGCDHKSTLREAVLGQGDFLALFRPEITDEERKQPETHFAAVIACLRERLDRLGHVLLVLDNVTDPALLVHQQTGCLTVLGPKLHLLATTRLAPPSGARGNWLTLGQLLEADALDLVEKHRPFASSAERDAAMKIVKRLGGFTLAVELMAAHLAAHPGVTCAQLADTIGLEDLETPEVLRSGDTLRYDHDRRLSAVLGPVLAGLSPAERRVLEYAALLPPDAVPLPWLRALAATDFPKLNRAERLTDPWGDLWRRLEKLALFSPSEDESSEPRLLRVHRLVQQLVWRDLAEAERTARQQAVDALVGERVTALEKTPRWEEARWELDPLSALAWLRDETRHPQADRLLSRTAVLWHNLAEWSQAEPLLRRALAVDEQSYGPEHPNVAIRLNNLAQLLQATNRLGEAEPPLRRALAIFLKFTRETGHQHPHLRVAIGNYEGLLQAMGRTEEEITAQLRAVAPEFFA